MPFHPLLRTATINESNHLISPELLTARVKDLLEIKLKWGSERKGCDFCGRKCRAGGEDMGGEGLEAHCGTLGPCGLRAVLALTLGEKEAQ